MTLDEAIIHAKELSENQSVCKDCREEHKQLAAWLDELKQYKEKNEHFKDNVETNFEHYKDRILDCCIDNLAVVKGIPKPCSKIDCNDCDFLTIKKDCHEIAKDWLKQPCKKSTCELTQFEYDLLQSYSNIYKLKFKTMPFLDRMKEKGYFKGINEDETIEDILAKCEVVG